VARPEGFEPPTLGSEDREREIRSSSYLLTRRRHRVGYLCIVRLLLIPH
jgi:hypothetical protein